MRKEKTITLREGDQTLTFIVRQMPLTKLEMFTLRLISLLSASARDAPDFNGLSEGLDWLKKQGGKALLSCIGHLDPDKAAPLLDELLGCCSRLVGAVETKCEAANIDAYMSDIETLLALRREALAINFGFFTKIAGRLSVSQDKGPGEIPA